jgi:hypothetical protein
VGRAAVEYSAASYTVAIQNSTIAFNAPGAGLGPNGRPATDQAVHLINAIVSNNGSP